MSASYVSRYRASTWATDRGGSKYSRRAGETMSRHDAAKAGGRASGNAAMAVLKGQLRGIPVSIAHDVARRAAPLMTQLTQQSFSAGQRVYGERRPTGVNGNELSLVKSGTTRDTLRFVNNGTVVRCVLAKPYMKYLIGKYGVLPNGFMPAQWERQLDATVDRVMGALAAA